MAKHILTTSHAARKDYNYELGSIRLNFSLRTDVKAEMVTFVELLKRATSDVEADLAKAKAK